MEDLLSTSLPCPQERFKDLEKEAKIKPFAKAGLQQKEKVDPAVEAKLSCEAWLRSCIARLAEQIEQFEVWQLRFRTNSGAS